MKWLVVILIVIVIHGSYTVYRHFNSIAKIKKRAVQKRWDRVESLVNWLNSGKEISQSDIFDYAKNFSTRESAYWLLQYCDLSHLFPVEFYTMEKAAESNLANWLDYPTELNAFPEEMNYIKTVRIEMMDQSDSFDYYVYRFRMHESHWAAANGWMLGVVGPYFQDSKPYDHPGATFSRLNNDPGKDAADEEAKWVHENIFLSRIHGVSYTLQPA